MLRINTEEGWRQMNALLENSGMDSNSEKLIELLKQCLQVSAAPAFSIFCLQINMHLCRSDKTDKTIHDLHGLFLS